MWKKTVGLLSILAVGVGLAGCQQRYEWRQKMTVVVDTPYGERSGSSVVEVVAHYGQLPLSASEVNYDVRGEAVVVEVLPRRFLFALLGENYTDELAASVWKDRLPRWRKDWLPEIGKLQVVRNIPKELYPVFVTFREIDNPESIEQFSEDAAGVFAEKIRIKAVTLEITNDPATDGSIYKVLPWFESAKVILPYEKKRHGNARRPVDDVGKFDFVRH